MKIFEVILKDGKQFIVKAKGLYVNDIGARNIGGTPTMYFIEPETDVYIDASHVAAIHEMSVDIHAAVEEE